MKRYICNVDIGHHIYTELGVLWICGENGLFVTYDENITISWRYDNGRATGPRLETDAIRRAAERVSAAANAGELTEKHIADLVSAMITGKYDMTEDERYILRAKRGYYRARTGELVKVHQRKRRGA